VATENNKKKLEYSITDAWFHKEKAREILIFDKVSSLFDCLKSLCSEKPLKSFQKTRVSLISKTLKNWSQR
jgi:hypothetical protein